MTMIDPGNAAPAPPFPEEPATPAYGENGILREEPDSSDPRRALVAQLTQEVREGKNKYEPAFKRMRDDMKFARGLHYPGQTDVDDDRAQVDIIQRHINNRVAALYAKNPTFIAERRKRMDFKIWDGDQAALQRAAEAVGQAGAAGMPPDPSAAMLMQDVQEGITRRRMLDRVGRTLEVLMDHIVAEQQPSFKARCKRLVRRAITCGVGYVKLGYQRELEARPDIAAELADITPRIAAYERMQADLADGLSDEQSADFEALQIMQTALQSEQDIVVREGLVFDFPAATRIIPDPNTTELVGWVGARWVAEEFVLSADEVKEIYNVDLGDTYTGYSLRASGETPKATARTRDRKCIVWVIHHKAHGVEYHVVDGYPDFLQEPGPPKVHIDQYFPFFPLVLNDQESEDELFPRSDVRLLRSTQREINRKKEAIRQHRIAARPRYIGQKAKFETQELKEIASLGAHEVLFIQGLEAGEKLEEVIQALPGAGVDPNLYETGSDMNDVQLIVGSSESAMGRADGNATATGDAIAEQSRMAAVSSNADDLDDLLTALARAAGQILLRELDAETAARIAGPGATWPVLDAQTIAEEVFLSIEAGSAGRPNQAQDIANFERLAPTLLQIPGITPDWLARRAVKILDNSVDYEDAITSGLPSITTSNRMAQPGTGDPATDPSQQGPQGAQNAPIPDQTAGGPQPAMPAPDAGPAQGVSAP